MTNARTAGSHNPSMRFGADFVESLTATLGDRLGEALEFANRRPPAETKR